MPTGYTHKVQEGKITELRDFAMSCARAFGACITMRDDPSDAPIPERFEPYTKYHDEKIAEARQILSELPELSPSECDRRAQAEHADEVDQKRRWARERAEHRQRYEAMQSKVAAWEVPAELHELRSFMLDQLKSSIEFDCHDTPYDKEPPLLSGPEWRAKTEAKAAHDLSYHHAEREKEIERTAERNRWLSLLRASL